MAQQAGAPADTPNNLSVIPGTQDSCKLPSNLDTPAYSGTPAPLHKYMKVKEMFLKKN